MVLSIGSEQVLLSGKAIQAGQQHSLSLFVVWPPAKRLLKRPAQGHVCEQGNLVLTVCHYPASRILSTLR